MEQKKQIKIIALMCLVTLLFTVGYVFAKYSGTFSGDYNQTSENFYFNSKAIERKNSISLYGGTSHAVDVDINNYADSLKVTPSDIEYSISIVANSYRGCAAKIGETVVTGGELTGGTMDSDIVTLHFATGYVDNTVVTIKFISNVPYAKTIEFNVNLFLASSTTYEIIDSSTSLFAELVILTENAIPADTLNVEWDSSVLNIDSTNTFVINSTKTTNANNQVYRITFAQIENNTEIRIKFFKNSASNNYSVAVSSITGNLITIS